MEEKNNFLGAIDYSQLATMDTKSEEEKRLDYEEEQRKKSLSISEDILKQAEQEPIISDHDAIQACIGEVNGQPSATLSTMLYRYSGDMQKFQNGAELLESDYSEESSRFFKTPIIDIKLKDEFVQFDFKFKTETDPELRILWSQLEMYGDLLNYYHLEKIKDYPFMMINIMPKKYIGRCYLSVCNPYYWTLEPEQPGVSINNVIRLIIKAENIIVTPDVLNEVDVQQTEAEIKRTFA